MDYEQKPDQNWAPSVDEETIDTSVDGDDDDGNDNTIDNYDSTLASVYLWHSNYLGI